jgi:hypothetical protein
MSSPLYGATGRLIDEREVSSAPASRVPETLEPEAPPSLREGIEVAKLRIRRKYGNHPPTIPTKPACMHRCGRCRDVGQIEDTSGQALNAFSRKTLDRLRDPIRESVKQAMEGCGVY